MAYFSKHYHAPGTAPGTLVSTDSDHKMSIHLIDYSGDHVEEQRLATAEECQDYLERDSKTWIQINGPVDANTLRALGDMFDLHDLALEDVLNSGQRPKMELYDDQVFLIAAMPMFDGERLEVVQVSLFAGTNYLICLCPLEEDPFEPVRKRIRQPNNRRFTSRGIDYLLYAMLDLITDSAFPVLETFGDKLEEMEIELLEHPRKQTLTALHHLKRELLMLRRVLWPQREALTTLMRMENSLIHQDTLIYFRDCQDHSIQIIELLESFRDMATSMLDIYLSSISQKTNDTMRVLTIIATIFIPLTFIVGVYGMNFEHPDSPWAMPELGWYYGYPMVWGLIIVVTAGLIWFFKRRHWM
ncbi:MAG: magnesium/cobalt transporter CorA [Marinobacter sp.]|uniref:magnesium/cobalt transporter CorA n=1 Tax=Marinobacter sp. TaxID=50741 RepID=UPI0029C45594|nr:magnesium/cobalt transporter CorA [Marinobacter sp.]MDX5334683.1 magnesium/cobalt transporter CorA [Marinobacter sp.]MDX5385226.1 magnesium/cobalt transporter CorA [Marinobacter sp.]MDX5442106.1 magnesium/cobalt transporter CorA [Alteromonadaceae bacterium]MDX5470929.1 magnesium/cobalt transporter CorA [Marinobacter sp.]